MEPPSDALTERVVQPAATAAEVHAFCGSCHAYPPADSFPRSYWAQEVAKGYHFYEMPTPESQAVRRRHIAIPPLNLGRALLRGTAFVGAAAAGAAPANWPGAVRFVRTECAIPDQVASPAVSNVNLVHLSDPHKLDLLTCDMQTGRLLALKPYEAKPTWRTLGRLANPAHTQVIDLDGDGIKDILVADLGNFTPTDNLCGRVVWLRGKPDGTYAPFTLLDNVGRVADVRAADFFGHGKLDLIVAVFGWRYSGSIFLLENQTTDWNHPHFVPHVLDTRTGTIHVPVVRS